MLTFKTRGREFLLETGQLKETVCTRMYEYSWA